MKAPCGVYQHHVGLLGHCRTHGIVRHGSRVGAHSLLDDVHARPVGPYLQLLHRCGAEGVGCAYHHLLALGAKACGQLANSGCLPHSVDAHYHYDIGLIGEIKGLDFLITYVYQLGNLVTQKAYQLLEGHVLVLAHPLLKIVYYLKGCIHTHIGGYEGFLDGIEGVVVHCRTGCDGPVELLEEVQFCLLYAFVEYSHTIKPVICKYTK